MMLEWWYRAAPDLDNLFPVWSRSLGFGIALKKGTTEGIPFTSPQLTRPEKDQPAVVKATALGGLRRGIPSRKDPSTVKLVP